jgi:Glu-tRNA(Gln) amidotransferase subunit E-like FAD-binding protein
MRKTVVDGSNTSGFQRTVLIGRNGFVETESGKVRIDTVMLEEDSARPAGKDEDSDENTRVYKLDRLGVPLVEIGTAPDIKTPEQAKEVALVLGDILRSCKVKRGIGTIRQDVNISIEGHPRVEIKGFQDVKMFVKTIESEVKRQEENLKNKTGNLEVRKANADGTTSFLRPMPGSSRMYPETDLPLLRISREIIDDAKKTLPKLREEVRDELMKQGVSENIVKILTSQGLVEDFKTMLDILDEPKFVAKVMIELPKEISSHLGKNVEDILTLDVVENILDSIVKNKIERNDVKHIMEEIVKGKSFDEAVKIEKIDLGNVESEIAKLVKEKPGLNPNAYMGLVMAKFKGKISGKEAMESINRVLKN